LFFTPENGYLKNHNTLQLVWEVEYSNSSYLRNYNNSMKFTDLRSLSTNWLDSGIVNYPDYELSALAQLNFIEFFKTNGIDTPTCFTKSYSLKRNIAKLDMLRLNNYIMRNGNRYKFLKLLLLAFNRYNSLVPIKPPKDLKSTPLHWKTIYWSLSTYKTSRQSNTVNPNFLDESSLNYSHLNNFVSTAPTDANIFRTFFASFKQTLPIFLFYIYKVDKKIFKNSRGKSGRHTFIWKYVPAYKRNSLVMHWLVKEMSLSPGKSIEERIYGVLRTFMSTPQQTWIYKIKKFSHNYVYKNSRKTLCETYRTATK